MTDLIAIDPGNKGGLGVCACAFFDSNKLVRLEYFDHEKAKGYCHPLRAVALEVPMIYPDGHERPNDLIKLAIAGALVAGAFLAEKLHTYTPAQWKGQKAKPACHWLMWQKLTEAERALFPAGTEARIRKGVEVNAPRMYAQPLKSYAFDAHNLLDAAAIGRFHLGLT